MRLVKQEVVQTKYYITIILYQELYTYIVPVNVGCSYRVYFSGFHCGKLINNFIKITLFNFVSFNPAKKIFSLNRFWLPPGLAPGTSIPICLLATPLSLRMAGHRQVISGISNGSQNIFIYNFIITTFDCQGEGTCISARAFSLARHGVALPLNQKFQFRQKNTE